MASPSARAPHCCLERAAKVYSCPQLDLMPQGPCSQIVDTLAPKYLHRGYLKAKVYTIWVHGPLSPKPYRTLIDPFKGTLKETLKGTLFGYMDP